MKYVKQMSTYDGMVFKSAEDSTCLVNFHSHSEAIGSVCKQRLWRICCTLQTGSGLC